MHSTAPTTVDDLLTLNGASREARAYAFLYAAFRRTEVGKNPVKDVIDCLTPFIAPYIKMITGQQVTSQGVQDYLKTQFGFDLPLYAIEQIISGLQAHGLVQYRTSAKIFVALDAELQFDVAKSEIETDFEELETELNLYARRLGYNDAPPSGGWGQAILNFLRNRTDTTSVKFITIKKVILDPVSVETATVAGYIRDLSTNDPGRFEKLLRIFMGTLVEDFISSIAEVGTIRSENPVFVFYDTTLLLRLLGSSGKSLQKATEELTRYLQDLGCVIQFLSGNDSEVSNIIDSIISRKDSGYELEGETALAIAAGEVTTTHLRGLQHIYTERLATFNIFPANLAESSAQENAKFQINEKGLAEFLKRKAKEHHRRYGATNSMNDAGYIGIVMRLRKGARTKDLAECRYLFATSNRFLANQSKRYLIQDRQLVHTSVPPALSVGQLATIAWLLKDHTLPPERASKELLTNCYAAIRPDAEWFGFFKEGLESVIGNTHDYLVDEGRAITLQAARRIAQEESFGNSAIMRQLNMAEVLSRAEEDSKALLDRLDEKARASLDEANREKEKALEAERTRASEQVAKLQTEFLQKSGNYEAAQKALQEQHAADLVAQANKAREDALAEVRRDQNAVAERRAGYLITTIKLIALMSFSFSTAYAVASQFGWIEHSAFKPHAAIFSAFVALIRFVDWMKFNVWIKWRDDMHLWILRRFGHS